MRITVVPAHTGVYELLDRLGMEVYIIFSCVALAIFILTPMAVVRRMRLDHTVLVMAVTSGVCGALLSWDWLRNALALIPFALTEVTLTLIFAVCGAAIFSPRSTRTADTEET